MKKTAFIPPASQYSLYRSLLFAGLLSLLLSGWGNAVQAQCRMTPEEMKPIIGRFNPFFTDHSWDDNTKTEFVRLDPTRQITVKQKACLRHHIMINMLIAPGEVGNSKKFWVTETLVMMKRIFFQNPDYLSWKRDFEVEFIKNFLANGTNELFNFPVGERTFICRIETGDWGAKIRMEVVRLILREKIRRPGVKREADTGWFKG